MGAPQLKPYHFQKGQSGNPGGKIKLPPELMAIKQFSKEEVARVIAKYGRLNRDEIEAVVDDRWASNLDAAVCRAWLASRSLSDDGSFREGMQALSLLLDRSVGKPAEVPVTELEESETITVTKDNVKDLYDIARSL